MSFTIYFDLGLFAARCFIFSTRRLFTLYDAQKSILKSVCYKAYFFSLSFLFVPLYGVRMYVVDCYFCGVLFIN